jgi:hypothetical protein
LDFSIKLPPHHLETVIDSISDAFASWGTRLLRFFSWSYGFAPPGNGMDRAAMLTLKPQAHLWQSRKA